MSEMRILQTIAGIRLDHGGTSRSVPALCDALGVTGIDWHLVTGTPSDPEVRCNFPVDMSRVCIVRESGLLRQLGVGKGFCRHLAALTSANRSQSLVHDHAVWLPTNHAVATFCRTAGVRRIVSPRGMLGAWALNHGRWKKKLAWWIYQYRDLVSADAFHATSHQEADEIRALGLTQPIAVIPNGISFPCQFSVRRRTTARRRMLFLSRIHPKKGLLELVHAWKKASIGPEWELVIAGPDEAGHRSVVEALVCQLGLSDSISFPGPLDDDEKWQAYADADVFVLPSFSENFGIVIAEALAAGLPVITTTGTPWQAMEEIDCGWWVKSEVDALSQTLQKVTKLPGDRLREMGQAGSAWVRQEFPWSRVATQMLQFYRWIINRENCPLFVHRHS